MKTTPEPNSIQYGCFDGLRGLEIEMSYSDALAGSMSGDCQDNIACLLRHPKIAAQFDALDPDDIRDGLRESGAWDAEELQDDDQNRRRALWMACCDIRENAGRDEE